MSYWLGVLDLELLRDAAPAAATGRWPRLRFVSLSPRAEAEPIAATLPEHVRRRVVLDPDPDLLASGQVQALLCSDPDETAARFPGVSIDDILTWADVDDAYGSWLRAVALPEEQDRLYRPSGLVPSDWRGPALAIELIGSCGAEFVQWAVPDVARELDAKLDAILTVRNHPGPGTRTATDPVPDLRLVVPPLRYMHPATLDDLVRHPDPERLFAETVAHLGAYLDSILAELPTTDLYVCGFLEPHENPDGAFFPERSLGNFRHFVRRLNDEVVAWCERSGATHFVDGDAIAGAIGKLGVDDGVLSFFGHRAPLDIYDDNVDAECGCENVAAAASFDMRTSRFTRAIVREIVHRHLIRGQADRVKAVIVDLDNTLWRGLASDGEIGAFNGRPQGLIEALLVMRRRGIFIAIASKNDEAYIRDHWEDILYRWPDEPLTVPLSLRDFDAVRIDFRSKALTVTEILDELNVLPEHAVFIDDNPLEREAVQAALPDLRILGAELNLVRRELLYSPFTQRDVRVVEDGLRAASAATQTELRQAVSTGDGSAFLRSLELGCAVSRVEAAGSLAGVRALQLINKTNQWTINAGRFGETELDARLCAGEQLLVATATDAHRSHGIVAAALICPASSSVSHLVMSCRVIGMGIDDAMMSALLDEYGPLTLDYAPTDRNRGATASLRRWLGAPPAGVTTVSSVACPEHVRLTVALASASR